MLPFSFFICYTTIMHPEYQYLNLLKDIMEKGAIKHEFNTGIEEKSLFGRQIRFDLSQGFPLLTTKKVFTRGYQISSG